MGRGRVQMKRIENPVQRQVTFCKRRAGLLKKAKELSVLCDAEIGVFIFSAHGKLYELATKGTMQELIERYGKYTGGPQLPDEPMVEPMDAKKEIGMLKQEIEILQKGLSYMFGGGCEYMSLDELLVLEKHLEIRINQIRSTKVDIMLQEIQMLRDKEGIMKAANKCLLETIEENISNTDFTTMTTNMLHPLTIANNIF
ncbi:agamous-like MADS-box protein AGL12 isoform X1 [Hibiscus syriacus]|uniref:agamous-like MADS-box protein AGL12 isoform X1 n=1 Tax=Hibiscus syriacus TaxID=106335 RepID=UPI001921A27C|nr:agamous-like MADS-box protein AGL12 isoform X1 [Hibiscus syriacus]